MSFFAVKDLSDCRVRMPFAIERYSATGYPEIEIILLHMIVQFFGSEAFPYSTD